MTTLNNFGYVDNVDNVQAAHVNQFFAGLLRGDLTNTESITATKQLTDADTPIQNITASGAARDVELAVPAANNHVTVIRNAGAANNVIVKNDTGATTYATLEPGQAGLFIPYAGTGWQYIESGGGGGAAAFTDLTDTPSSYSTHALKTVRVNSGETGLEFYTPASATSREILTANRTYYVRVDGSDSNNGLTNTAGGAFLTIQKAVNVVAGLDRSIYDVTIQVGNGTYNLGTTHIVLLEGVGGKRVYITGDTTTPANVVIQMGGVTTSVGAFTANGISTLYEIKGFRFIASGFNAALYATNGSSLFFGNVEFGGGFIYHVESVFGANVEAVGNYRITGGTTTAHLTARASGGIRIQSKTITLTGTPSLWIFADARYCAVYFINANTFSGSATGSRYRVDYNAVIQSGGATLPGSTAGTTATGGQYA